MTQDALPPGDRLRASVVVIGDELLAGYVRDSNSYFLACRLRDAGVPLERVVVVADEVDAIGEAVLGELARRRPRLVLTSGGVGPTPDDVTVAAVAQALGRSLVAHPEAVANVEEALSWTREQGLDVPPEQAEGLRLLADLPEGAWLLAARPGQTPGVAVDVDGGSRAGGATVVVLPGVPSELERVVVDGVGPELLVGHGRDVHTQEVRHGFPESFLGPLLADLAASEPEVTVGSYPGPECVVRLRGEEEAVARAAARVRRRVAELEAEPGTEQVRARWAARWA